jgi:hypothetical protein
MWWQGATPKEETKCGTKVAHHKALMAKWLGAQREVTCLEGKPLNSQGGSSMWLGFWI